MTRMAYLVMRMCSIPSPVIVPEARFSVHPSLPISGSPATFVDTGVGGGTANWEWDFGDGSEIAGIQNPTHTYTMNGAVQVTMTCTIGDCGTHVTGRWLQHRHPRMYGFFHWF